MPGPGEPENDTAETNRSSRTASKLGCRGCAEMAIYRWISRPPRSKAEAGAKVVISEAEVETTDVRLLRLWGSPDKLRSGDVATRDSPHRESHGGEVEDDDKVDSYGKEDDEIESHAGEEMISKPGYCGLGSSAFWLQLGFGGSLILWKTTRLTKTVHNRLAPDWNHQSCQLMGFHAVTEISNDRLVTWLLMAMSRPQSSGE
ncbi:hypothetical protein ACFE04_009993 [Oxalis oulophora]